MERTLAYNDKLVESAGHRTPSELYAKLKLMIIIYFCYHLSARVNRQQLRFAGLITIVSAVSKIVYKVEYYSLA